MSKDANSFGHDKALAWESRGFVYTKRGCIVSTHPHVDRLEVNAHIGRSKTTLLKIFMTCLTDADNWQDMVMQ